MYRPNDSHHEVTLVDSSVMGSGDGEGVGDGGVDEGGGGGGGYE